MKLTIEPTGIIEKVDGIDCRLWEGTSDKGVPVKAWVRTVQPQTHDAGALADFDAELRRGPAPVFSGVEQIEICEPPADWEKQHDELVARIRPLFAGIYPAVQGSVLSYFTALWIAGHQCDEEGHQLLLVTHTAQVVRWLPLAREEIEAIKARMGAALQ